MKTSAQYLAPSKCSKIVTELMLNLGIKIRESRYRHMEIMSKNPLDTNMNYKMLSII